MPVILEIRKHVAGSRCPINGKRRPDSYHGTKNPTNGSWPTIVFPTAEAFNAVAEDIFLGVNNPALIPRIIPEVSENDAALLARTEAAEKTASEAMAQLDGLRQEVEQLKLKTGENPDAEEYGKLIAILTPHALETDVSPSAALIRLLADKPIAEPAEPASTETEGEADEPHDPAQPLTPPKNYHKKLKWARTVLGLTIDGNPTGPELDALISETLAARAQ